MTEERKEMCETMAKFVGKTIQRIDCASVNFWSFYFTDATFISIDTEYFGSGLYGLVSDEFNNTDQYKPIDVTKLSAPKSGDGDVQQG